MRRRINLLAMLFVCGGAAGLMAPVEASGMYLPPEEEEQPKQFCCYHQWSSNACCFDSGGCRITSSGCVQVQ
jgi:hypothetical protein